MSLKDLLPEDTYDKLIEQAQSRDPKHTEPNTQATTTATSATQVVMVRCPTCHKLVPYTSSNPFRPFCSERCKLIDLGAWAKEERTIPSNDLSDDIES